MPESDARIVERGKVIWPPAVVHTWLEMLKRQAKESGHLLGAYLAGDAEETGKRIWPPAVVHTWPLLSVSFLLFIVGFVSILSMPLPRQYRRKSYILSIFNIYKLKRVYV